jgi:hypothetical protein
MALRSSQPLTEMSTGNLPGEVKGFRRVSLTNLPPSVTRMSRENVGTSNSHNPMGPSRSVTGTSLTFYTFITIGNAKLQVYFLSSDYAEYCEHVNETSSFIKGGTFLSDYIFPRSSVCGSSLNLYSIYVYTYAS